MGARLLGFTLALSSPGGATAQEPDSLQAAPDSAVADTMRIDPLRNNAVDLAGDQLAADPFENSWPLFGTGARMAIGGYVKLDYVQDEGRDALASPGISQEDRQTSEELHTEGLLRQPSEMSAIRKSNPSWVLGLRPA